MTKKFDNFIDYQAGIAFINFENEAEQTYSSYITFKSGYQLKSHKHKDDLSLTYMYKGDDILIDSGKYTYDKKNPKKAYIMSPEAHSTIYKYKEDYTLNDSVVDFEKLKINFVFEGESFIHIGAINHLYTDLKIYRDVLIFEDRGILIIDRVLSNETETSAQNFNLDPAIKVKKINSREYILATANGYNLTLKEHGDRTISRYINEEYNSRGFFSLKFNQLLRTQQIEFRNKSKESRFITSIFDDQHNNLENLKFEDGIIKFILNCKMYQVNLQKIE